MPPALGSLTNKGVWDEEKKGFGNLVKIKTRLQCKIKDYQEIKQCSGVDCK